MVKIKGFIPFSLIDYPSLISCVIFLGGCNFKCPWCHNFNLVDEESLKKIEDIPFQKVLDFLGNKKGKIDGVCISGGEPTIYGNHLFDFINKIKEKNFLIKIDTNGSNPDIIEKLIKENLVDFVAVDIKNTYSKYPKTIGLNYYDCNKITKTIEILKKNKVKFQTRTTLVDGLVDKDEMDRFAKDLGLELIFQEYKGKNIG